MKIKTKYLGIVEVAEDKMITFPTGLPGFLDEKQFIILDLPGNDAFQLLQSVETSGLAFVITNPYLFSAHYELKINEQLLQTLDIQSEKDVAVYAIVTLQDPFRDSTMNLRAPIIINTSNLTGKQYILNDDKYSSKASLTTEAKGAESC